MRASIWGGGNGNMIEIDESKLGRRKYNGGHMVERVWIFGAVKRHTRRILLCSVMQRNRTELKNIMFKYILPYSIIYSDSWKAYSN